MDLSQSLKTRALKAGAAAAGIAPAEPLREAAAYKRWIAAGMQGSMDYMARNQESRENIAHWYPQAKSVLVCAFAYPGGAKQDSSEEGLGRVSRYAVLPDYHDEIRIRMESILDWVKRESPGTDGRIFTDTSPLLERLYARYAGIGWVGKNAMLISEKIGSYFFLSGLALDIRLDQDDPSLDRCGSCDKCLKSCPTGAFAAPRVLDASRCVAYFTVEHKGKIPEEFRQGVGDWIMGCDVCQEVCPWNRFSSSGSIFSAVLPRALDLEEIANAGAAEFKTRYGKTPMSRPKRRGIIRNALLAMGNSLQKRHRQTLERFSRHPDPVLREQAHWSLERIASTRENSAAAQEKELCSC
ncbi:MAG: tRNA epoxyqueuosine(34) reductase QueG [Elusimicrobiota bacterium]